MGRDEIGTGWVDLDWDGIKTSHILYDRREQEYASQKTS